MDIEDKIKFRVFPISELREHLGKRDYSEEILKAKDYLISRGISEVKPIINANNA